LDVTALASPSLSFAWAGLSLFKMWRGPEPRRQVLFSLVVAAALAVPWAIRNACVFHAFVPTKSNLFFEAYQANYLDDDGIYDGTFDEHPYNSKKARAEYAELGEMRYVAQHKAQFLDGLAADPARYARAVLHRLLAVTVRYVPSKTAFEKPLKAAVQRVVYALPFAALLSLVWFRGRARPYALGLAAFAGVYLVPYVVVAFYLRYMMPLTPVLLLITFTGIDQAAAALASGAPRTPRRSAARPGDSSCTSCDGAS
jgi:hypothetical protein